MVDQQIMVEQKDGYRVIYQYRAKRAALDLRNSAGVHVRDTLAQGGTVFERRHRRKDGSELPVEIRTAPFMPHGQQRIMATVRDLTQSKAAEEALRQAAGRVRESKISVPRAVCPLRSSAPHSRRLQGCLEPCGRQFTSRRDAHALPCRR